MIYLNCRKMFKDMDGYCRYVWNLSSCELIKFEKKKKDKEKNKKIVE